MFARKPGKGITLEMYRRNTQVNKKKKKQKTKKKKEGLFTSFDVKFFFFFNLIGCYFKGVRYIHCPGRKISFVLFPLYSYKPIKRKVLHTQIPPISLQRFYIK